MLYRELFKSHMIKWLCETAKTTFWQSLYTY